MTTLANSFLSRRKALFAGLAGTAGFTAAIVGGVRIVSAQITSAPAGTRDFASFLPGNFSGTDDVGPYLQEAARWSGANATPVWIRGRFRLGTPVRIDRAGTRLQFADARFNVASNLAAVRTGIGNVHPVALHVTADNVRLEGSFALAGLGALGRSFLQGLYADEVNDLVIGDMAINNMAIGQHFMCCTRVVCGAVDAADMWGLQGSGRSVVGAGSAQVVAGCRNSRFGAITSERNDKPVRYLSVGLPRSGGMRDNAKNTFGFVRGTARTGSPWAQLTAVRSSVDSTFAGGSGENMSYLLLCEKYPTDAALSISGNQFGNWSGTVADSSASIDAAIYFNVVPGGGTIGSNRIGKVSARCTSSGSLVGGSLPQTFGVWLAAGTLAIDTLALDGFMTQVQASDGRLTVGDFQSRRAQFALVRYGRGLSARFDNLTVEGDLSGPVRSPGLFQAIDTGNSRSAAAIDVASLDCSAVPASPRFDYITKDDFGRRSVRVGNGRGACLARGSLEKAIHVAAF